MKRTEKQENFALEYFLNGRDATEAYKKVYDTTTDSMNTIYVSAHKVLHNPKVSLRIHQLEIEQYSKHILSVEERKILLTEWAKKGDGKAVDMLNKMDGVYVEKQEITATQEVHYYAPKKDEDKQMWGLAVFGLSLVVCVYLTGAFLYDMFPYNEKQNK